MPEPRTPQPQARPEPRTPDARSFDQTPLEVRLARAAQARRQLRRLSSDGDGTHR